MQGLVLDGMRIYIAQRYGYRAWLQTLQRSGRPATYQYLLDQGYPSEELEHLAKSAAEVTRTPVLDLLGGFGRALVPDMMRVYSYLIEPDWTYIDFLMNMHSVLDKALPGKIHATRVGPGMVRISYASPAQLCAVVEGIILGAAREYAVSSSASQVQCVLRRDRECVFEVRLHSKA